MTGQEFEHDLLGVFATPLHPTTCKVSVPVHGQGNAFIGAIVGPVVAAEPPRALWR